MITVYMYPSEIRYTQDTIKAYFQNGPSLRETLGDLLAGLSKLRDRRPMRIVYRRGKYWTLNNRTLWVYQELERYGACGRVKMLLFYLLEIDLRKFFGHLTTKTEGQTVKIRGARRSLWRSCDRVHCTKSKRFQHTPALPSSSESHGTWYRDLSESEVDREEYDRYQSPIIESPCSRRVEIVTIDSSGGPRVDDLVITPYAPVRQDSGYWSGETDWREDSDCDTRIAVQGDFLPDEVKEVRRVFFTNDRKAWGEFLALRFSDRDSEAAADSDETSTLSECDTLPEAKRKHSRKPNKKQNLGLSNSKPTEVTYFETYSSEDDESTFRKLNRKEKSVLSDRYGILGYDSFRKRKKLKRSNLEKDPSDEGVKKFARTSKKRRHSVDQTATLSDVDCSALPNIAKKKRLERKTDKGTTPITADCSLKRPKRKSRSGRVNRAHKRLLRRLRFVGEPVPRKGSAVGTEVQKPLGTFAITTVITQRQSKFRPDQASVDSSDLKSAIFETTEADRFMQNDSLFLTTDRCCHESCLGGNSLRLNLGANLLRRLNVSSLWKCEYDLPSGVENQQQVPNVQASEISTSAFTWTEEVTYRQPFSTISEPVFLEQVVLGSSYQPFSIRAGGDRNTATNPDPSNNFVNHIHSYGQWLDWLIDQSSLVIFNNRYRHSAELVHQNEMYPFQLTRGGFGYTGQAHSMAPLQSAAPYYQRSLQEHGNNAYYFPDNQTWPIDSRMNPSMISYDRMAYQSSSAITGGTHLQHQSTSYVQDTSQNPTLFNRDYHSQVAFDSQNYQIPASTYQFSDNNQVQGKEAMVYRNQIPAFRPSRYYDNTAHTAQQNPVSSGELTTYQRDMFYGESTGYQTSTPSGYYNNIFLARSSNIQDFSSNNEMMAYQRSLASTRLSNDSSVSCDYQSTFSSPPSAHNPSSGNELAMYQSRMYQSWMTGTQAEQELGRYTPSSNPMSSYGPSSCSEILSCCGQAVCQYPWYHNKSSVYQNEINSLRSYNCVEPRSDGSPTFRDSLSSNDTGTYPVPVSFTPPASFQNLPPYTSSTDMFPTRYTSTETLIQGTVRDSTETGIDVWQNNPDSRTDVMNSQYRQTLSPPQASVSTSAADFSYGYPDNNNNSSCSCGNPDCSFYTPSNFQSLLALQEQPDSYYTGSDVPMCGDQRSSPDPLADRGSADNLESDRPASREEDEYRILDLG